MHLCHLGFPLSHRCMGTLPKQWGECGADTLEGVCYRDVRLIKLSNVLFPWRNQGSFPLWVLYSLSTEWAHSGVSCWGRPEGRETLQKPMGRRWALNSEACQLRARLYALVFPWVCFSLNSRLFKGHLLRVCHEMGSEKRRLGWAVRWHRAAQASRSLGERTQAELSPRPRSSLLCLLGRPLGCFTLYACDAGYFCIMGPGRMTALCTSQGFYKVTWDSVRESSNL